MIFHHYCADIIFGQLSGSAVTAYEIYYKIQQSVFSDVFGLNNAIIHRSYKFFVY